MLKNIVIRNKKTQIVTKLNYSSGDKTKALKLWPNSKLKLWHNSETKLWQNSKTEMATKPDNPNCYESQKLKLWQNSINSKYDHIQELKYDKDKNVTTLKPQLET